MDHSMSGRTKSLGVGRMWPEGKRTPKPQPYTVQIARVGVMQAVWIDSPNALMTSDPEVAVRALQAQNPGHRVRLIRIIAE